MAASNMVEYYRGKVRELYATILATGYHFNPFHDVEIVKPLDSDDDNDDDDANVTPPRDDIAKLRCVECGRLPRDPETIPCGHVGCSHCFRELLNEACDDDEDTPGYREKRPCPRCRVLFTNDDREKLSGDLLKAYEAIAIKCDRQCGFVGSPIAVIEHERIHCMHRVVRCIGEDCYEVGQMQDMLRHAQRCRKILVFCKDCGWPIYMRKANKHDCAAVEKRFSEKRLVAYVYRGKKEQWGTCCRIERHSIDDPACWAEREDGDGVAKQPATADTATNNDNKTLDV